MAISNGSMKRIIGPTRPMLGSPAAFVPKPPSPSTGIQPVSMKNAVMKPQAMKAAMFGMIMPDRKVPNFCTATRAPPVLLGSNLGIRRHAVPPRPRVERRRLPTCSHRDPS